MTEIPLHTSGDVWLNKHATIENIRNVPPTELVIFNTLFEGISLKASGILQVVDNWVLSTGRDPSTVQFDTPNQFEKINYRFANYIRPGAHFFKTSLVKYHKEYTEVNQQGKMFGLFLGRYTQMRNSIADHVVTAHKPNFLISIMKSDRLGSNDWWAPAVEAIGSLDNMMVDHQYDKNYNTNQSLLNFYNDFQIEFVVETITAGESFFPTEKSVRPIMGSKPFLTYATIDFLRNFKELGFRTFSELWSEDYDQFEGFERWARMTLLVANIIEHGYDCDLANKIVQYNYNHLQKIMKSYKNR